MGYARWERLWDDSLIRGGDRMISLISCITLVTMTPNLLSQALHSSNFHLNWEAEMLFTFFYPGAEIIFS